MKKLDVLNIVKEEVKLAMEDLIGYRTTHAVDVLGLITKSLENVDYEIVKSNFTATGAECVAKAKDGVSYKIDIRPISNTQSKPYVSDGLMENSTPPSLKTNILIDGKPIFLKATGNNRYAGGSKNWLRIRGIHKEGDAYELHVIIRGRKLQTTIRRKEYIEYLKFATQSGQPISPDAVMDAYDTAK
jgi:hypothetical protein